MLSCFETFLRQIPVVPRAFQSFQIQSSSSWPQFDWPELLWFIGLFPDPFTLKQCWICCFYLHKFSFFCHRCYQTCILHTFAFLSQIFLPLGIINTSNHQNKASFKGMTPIRQGAFCFLLWELFPVHWMNFTVFPKFCFHRLEHSSWANCSHQDLREGFSTVWFL